MRRDALGSGVGSELSPAESSRVARHNRLATAVVTALVLVGCGAGGTVSESSPASIGTPYPGEGPVSGSGMPAGLGAPLAVQPVDRVSLSALVVHALGTTPAGELWVAGSEREGRAPVAPYTEWAYEPLATGVWRGTVGQPGTWYPMGSVEGLTAAPDGRVWVITGTALATFDDGTWRRVLDAGGGVLSGVSGWVGGASSLAVGPDGVVWATGPTFDSLVRFDGDVTVLTGPGFAGDGTVCGIGTLAVTADGTVWTADATPWGHGGCLLRWEGTTWTRVRPPGLPDFSISRLAADTDGGLWAWLLRCERDENTKAAPWSFTDCGQASLAHFDGSSWTLRSHGPWSGPGPVDVSMAAVDGNLWLAVNRRLFLFDGGGFLQVPAPPGVNLPITAVLTADADEAFGSAGVAWVVTSDGVLHRVPTLPAR